MTKYRIKEVFVPHHAPVYYPQKRIFGLWVNFSKINYLDFINSYIYEGVSFKYYDYAVMFLNNQNAKKSIRIYPYKGE